MLGLVVCPTGSKIQKRAGPQTPGSEEKRGLEYIDFGDQKERMAGSHWQNCLIFGRTNICSQDSWDAPVRLGWITRKRASSGRGYKYLFLPGRSPMLQARALAL